VPEGFAIEQLLPGDSREGELRRPWVHLRGEAHVRDVVDFYVMFLDPGTPIAGGVPARGVDGEEVPCQVVAARVRKGCQGPPAECVDRVCLDQGATGYLFQSQHPRPPGDPSAVVSVRVGPFAGGVRVTIENETIVERLEAQEPVAPAGLSSQGEMSKYRDAGLEQIPAELID
jgi:hypothetical protein